MSRSRVAALMTVLVLVAGCTGAGGGGGDAAAPQSAELARSGDAATVANEEAAKPSGEGGDGSGGSADAVQQVQTRKLIQTATVRLRVEDYDRARERLAGAASDRGGFVSDASSRLHTTDSGNYTTGRVTFRVPSEEFDAFLGDVNRTGTVLQSERNTEDVTDQLVDINARLENLRAERQRLRELYQQANDTEDVLQVERRLSEVQTQIERLEAKKESLNRQVALSTVTVELVEPRPDPIPGAGEQWYDTPLTEAFLSSVQGVIVAVRAIGVGLAYALPYLIVFAGPPVLGGVLLVRRFRGGGDGNGGDGGGDPATDLGPTERDDGGADPDAEGSVGEERATADDATADDGVDGDGRDEEGPADETDDGGSTDETDDEGSADGGSAEDSTDETDGADVDEDGGDESVTDDESV